MHLRPTTSQDYDLIRYWDQQPHLQGLGGEDEFNDWDWDNQLGRTVTWREMLIAEIEARPVGFIQIIDCREEETHYWGDDCPEHARAIDIWIGEESDIGRGYGTQMMQLALARCFAHQLCQHVLIDPLTSNTKAHRFYEAMGFKFLGPRQFGPDQCSIYQITRADWRNGETK